ncbi:MAG: glycosyltransferase family 4 protein [Methyloligellaceae bacterium]
MKICQLCNLDFTLYHFLLPLMRGMGENGHEVVGVCSDGEFADKVRGAGFRVETVSIHRSFNIFRHMGSIGELAALFRREKFDIVHVHNPVAALVGRVAAWRAGVACIVYTAHGFYFHEHMPVLKRYSFIALEWLAGRVTDVLFTQSREDEETARRLKLIPGGHIEAIGNGVDAKRFHASGNKAERKRVREGVGTPVDRVAIMTLGRLVVEKGFPELIEAMRHIDADLWVVGERLDSDHAPGIEHVLNLARSDKALKHRVHFLGYRNDIPDLLRAADIFVSASHREGMPRSIIEAMMCGLPVVATNIRGSREEVVDGETGLLVAVKSPEALGRALSTLVDRPATRRQFGAAGRKRARALYEEKKVIARQIRALGL